MQGVRMLQGRKGVNTMTKKYKVREGSIADYARVSFVGLVFGLLIGLAAITSYPI